MIDWSKLSRLATGFVLLALVLWCSLLTSWQMQDERNMERLWRLYEGVSDGHQAAG